MHITIINEVGYEEAMMGLSLSYNRPVARMGEVARKLAKQDGGHNKFLESMVVYLEISAARYWWQEFDAYRIGVTKQSESTMHTLMRSPLEQRHFESPILPEYLSHLNRLREESRLRELKNALPEGFLQTRLVCVNYKCLRNMYLQRRDHDLPEWGLFCDMVRGLKHWGELFDENSLIIG